MKTAIPGSFWERSFIRFYPPWSEHFCHWKSVVGRWFISFLGQVWPIFSAMFLLGRVPKMHLPAPNMADHFGYLFIFWIFGSVVLSYMTFTKTYPLEILLLLPCTVYLHAKHHQDRWASPGDTQFGPGDSVQGRKTWRPDDLTLRGGFPGSLLWDGNFSSIPWGMPKPCKSGGSNHHYFCRGRLMNLHYTTAVLWHDLRYTHQSHLRWFSILTREHITIT